MKYQLETISLRELISHFSIIQSLLSFRKSTNKLALYESILWIWWLFTQCINILFKSHSNYGISCNIQRSPHSHLECFGEPANFKNLMVYDIFFKSTMIYSISVLERLYFLPFHSLESAQQTPDQPKH